MKFQRIQKSSTRNSQTPQKTSSIVSRPFAIQAQQEFEAAGLKIQEKHDAIAPEKGEQLGVLQAKMNDLYVQRMEQASRFGDNFANISVHRPDAPPLAQIQPKLTIGQPGDKYEQEADSMARQVVQRIHAPMPSSGRDLSQPESEFVQRMKANLVQRQQLQKKGQVEENSNAIAASEVQQENNTGMPDNLKTGIENLSGISMDDVKVHYNSSEPAELQALAYTQGTDIHVAPGQEQHLPHEAWHVVQQKQGRVKPSIQMKGINANFDSMLEKEADEMGEKALNIQSVESRLPSASQSAQSSQLLGQPINVVQRSLTGTPVRQFRSGSGAKKKSWKETNVGAIDETSTQDKLVLQNIADTGEIKDVEVAINLLHKKKLVETQTVPVQEYRITDTTHFFYTATSPDAVASIIENGLDPNYGGTRNVGTTTAWNCQGHSYFSLNEVTARNYGKAFIGKDYVLLKFTLPAGHIVTPDPELRNGTSTALRTAQLIPGSNIQRA